MKRSAGTAGRGGLMGAGAGGGRGGVSRASASDAALGYGAEDLLSPGASGGLDDGVFSVFWGDRLVPDTVVKRLPFFPAFKSFFTKEGLPANVEHRIKGFLFLDWNFKHISNNKLSIQVDPSFSAWMNSIEEVTITHPTDATSKFAR